MRLLTILLALLVGAPAAAEITVASKLFTESVVLGEMARIAIAEQTGEEVVHRRELGGTRILFDALEAGEIDVYPDYTGTLRFEVLAADNLQSDEEIATALARRGLRITPPLGFSNTYAIAVTRATAERLNLRTTSDLAAHPDIRFGLSNEFVDRADGWQALKAAYDLPQTDVQGMFHDLGYRALVAGQIDAMDAYTTDPQIAEYDLVLLEDDRQHFPVYDAVYVYRDDLPDAAAAALDRFAGTLDLPQVQRLNARVQTGGESESAVAAEVVGRILGTEPAAVTADEDGIAARIWQRTREHLALVGLALGLAILIAIPLGIAAARLPRFGNAILAAVGILQTIPSLALFVILIPLLGIGFVPTIAALFVYSLLPIVRNTHAGLTGIAPALLDSADALGLTRWQRLLRIELPLAAPTIMAGIKTAAVIAVGLATLGAIIGAGGYGQPILTGIRLASTPLILEGAIPAAVLALLMQALFDLAERGITPRGLRLKQASR